MYAHNDIHREIYHISPVLAVVRRQCWGAPRIEREHRHQDDAFSPGQHRLKRRWFQVFDLAAVRGGHGAIQSGDRAAGMVLRYAHHLGTEPLAEHAERINEPRLVRTNPGGVPEKIAATG